MTVALWLAALAVATPRGPVEAQQTGAWVDLPSLNLLRQESGTAVLGGAVYVIGGLTHGGGPPTTDTVERWRPGDPSWSFAPPLLEPIDHPAVAVHAGEIWTIGGERQLEPRDVVQIFDPTVGEWRYGPPLPTPRAAGAAATLDGRLYYLGGVDFDRRATAAVFVLDRESAEWKPAPSMTLARDHLSAVVLGDGIYVSGGRRGFTSLDLHERFDPADATWTVLAPVPTARSAAGAVALGGRLWVGGGEFPVLFDVNEVYDPATDTWETAPALPLPRHGTQPVVIDGLIVWPGGGRELGFTPTDHVDAFRPDLLFADGFELGDVSLWSAVVGGDERRQEDTGDNPESVSWRGFAP
ncbi:MAG: hypothetical protein AAGF23_02140 [Acidobacteriota bacterium]